MTAARSASHFDVFVEAPDELLEEGAHLVVVEAVRVFRSLGGEVDAGFLVEAGEHEIKPANLVEDADGIVEPEAVEDFADVFREAVDVGFQATGKIGVIVEESVEGDGRGVVKREASGAAKGVVAVVEALSLQLGLGFHDLVLGGCQGVIEAAQDRERQDDVLVFALGDRPVEVLGDFPQETGDAADVLGIVRHTRVSSGESRRFQGRNCRSACSRAPRSSPRCSLKKGDLIVRRAGGPGKGTGFMGGASSRWRVRW